MIGTSGIFFECLLAREGPPSSLFNNSRNLTSSSRGLRLDITGKTTVPERETRREPQNSSILVPRFQSGAGFVDHTGGTCSHNGMTDYPRFLFSELHLGKFPDSLEFQKQDNQRQD